MKPTENKPSKKELIDHIKEGLVDYEMSYSEGAWERFNQPKKSKKLVFWLPLLSGAAAVLILGVATFFIVQQNSAKQEDLQTEVVKAKNSQQQEEFESTVSNNSDKVMSNSSQKYSASKRLINKNVPLESADKNTNIAQLKALSTPKEIVNFSSKDTSEIAFSEPIVNTIEEQPILANTAVKENNIVDFLEKETKLNQLKAADAIAKNNKDKFTVGLVVAPSFGNVKRLNMGYGVSLDYKISPKFSLNTGLAYNQMAAETGVPMDNRYAAPTISALAQTASTKNLESIEERVTGIEIPLEIKYHVNSNVYANIGVSVFGVIDQQRNNTFIEEKIVPQSYSVNGRSTFDVTTVATRVTEKDIVVENEDYSYLGFYNFAFGFKKKLSKKNAFAIEPFLKLPMREVKTENLRLIGTGVKLKFDF